ncbi:MAG: hypothetical protein LBO69_00770 [Ignavibacteria bacterium]|jgi:hypothetical protein|nr:hypothetical protein [Ignavibacteria bacterium]
MKKILLIVAIIFATTLTAFAQFSGGSGTQADPYQITSKADMEALADSLYHNGAWSVNKYFSLMNDITDSITRPIASLQYTSANDYWYGNFDGNNHRIICAIDSNYTYDCALFGINSYTSVIRNLIVDGYIKCSTGQRAAAIASDNYGLISNCVNLAKITNNSLYAGGITNINFGTIERCTNLGTIESSEGTGGICAIIHAGQLVDCVNAGLVFSYGSYYSCCGGIAGEATNGTITRCINTNAVEGTLSAGTLNVGAIVGNIYSTLTITDCFYDIQMCKYKAVNNQDHPGVTGLPTHLLMEELAK